MVYGVNAALAVAVHRPESILRAFYTQGRRKAVGALLKATAAQRRPYREVGDEELARIARTQHHEGVVVVTTPLKPVDLPALVQAMGPSGVIMALDGVDNPHNIGAILRSAAWFGAGGLLIADATERKTLPSAALRIAQGGAETVPCALTTDLPGALAQIKDHGVRIFGADARATMKVPGAAVPKPVCLVMGHEGRGLSRAVKAQCDQMISIPGTGQIESLNVAVAAGILFSAALTA